MSRIFLDDLRATINSQIITNNTGAITAAILKPILIDAVDSLANDEGKLRRDAEQAGVALTTAYTTPVVYDYEEGGNLDFVIIDQGAGTISSGGSAGFSYAFVITVTLVGTQNVRYDLIGMLNGAPAGAAVSGTGEGINDPITLILEGTSLSTPANTSLEIGLRADVAGAVDILSAALRLDVLPTNNAT
jgi:hypothetical protein